MNKVIAIIFIVIILLMCSVPLALALLGFNSPSVEKRAPAPFPSLFSVSGEVNSNFTADLDSYIADNFPLRTLLISSWHQLNISLLGQTGNSSVVLGDDGWLFFADSVPSYLGQDAFTAAEYSRLDTILRLQAEYLASRGIKFLYTVAPNKSTIYPDLMPDRYTCKTDANALAGVAVHLATPGYIDLRSLLTTAADGSEPLYHRTDSHWNNRGALIAFLEILNQASPLLGLNLATPYQSAGVSETASWEGDLAAMLFPSGPALDIQQHFQVEQSYRYTRPLKSLEDLQIMTRSDGERSLLMFRDSFANALIPMISETFADAAYSRGVPYDYTLLDKMEADLVILEIVERNLATWLDTPPRMPVQSLAGEKPATQAAVVEMKMTAESESGYIKVSGQLTGNAIDASWTRVLMSIGGLLFEAFPVTFDGQTETAGFVLYFTADAFVTLPAACQIMVQIDSGWIAVDSVLPIIEK